MANLVLKGVKKVYPGNVMAVKDFNMEIQDKEFIVLETRNILSYVEQKSVHGVLHISEMYFNN